MANSCCYVYVIAIVGQSGGKFALSFRPQKNVHDWVWYGCSELRVRDASTRRMCLANWLYGDQNRVVFVTTKLTHQSAYSKYAKMVAQWSSNYEKHTYFAMCIAVHLQKAILAPVMRQTFANKLVDRFGKMKTNPDVICYFSRRWDKAGWHIRSVFLLRINPITVKNCEQKKNAVRGNGRFFSHRLYSMQQRETLMEHVESVNNPERSRKGMLSIWMAHSDAMGHCRFKIMVWECLKNILKNMFKKVCKQTKQHGNWVGFVWLFRLLQGLHHEKFEIDSISGVPLQLQYDTPLLKVLKCRMFNYW